MFVTRFRFALLAVVFFTAVALAQTGGGGGSGGSGGTGGGGSTGGGSTGGGSTGGGTTTVRPAPTQQPQLQQQVQRPIFVAGAVVMDDGTPAPRGVYIERVCGGRATREGVTDSTGHFSLQLGRDAMLYADASTDMSFGRSNNDPFSSNLGGGLGSTGSSTSSGLNSETALLGCELRASSPGFRSSVVDLSQHHAMDSPEVGTIILERLDRVQGTMTSVNSARAPKDARKAFEHAMASVKKKHDDEAQPELEKAVAIYPQYAQAWLELGRVRERQSHFEEARAAYNKALEADNRYVDPYLQLADLAVRAQDWKQTAHYTGKAIELDPIDYPMACFFNAVANYNLGEIEQAEKSARRVKLLDGQRKIQQVDRLLGMILYAKKDYSGAIDSMRSYLDKAPNASDAASVRQQLAELERMRAGAHK